LEEGPEGLATLAAVEFDIFELREDASAPGYYARDADQCVQMDLAKVTKRIRGRELRDADVNFWVNALVVGIVKKNGLERDCVEQSEHRRRRVR
jgi:hypothetical protein